MLNLIIDNFMLPIALNLVDINKIVISDKFKHSDKGFKYFVGYTDDNIIGPLCIVLPQISGYIKYFDIDGKNRSFKLKIVLYWWNIVKCGRNLKRYQT